MPVSKQRKKKKKIQKNEIKHKVNILYKQCYKEFINRDYNTLVRFAKWVKAGYIKKFSWVKKQALTDAIKRHMVLKRIEYLNRQKK